jgi:hypothetical protein
MNREWCLVVLRRMNQCYCEKIDETRLCHIQACVNQDWHQQLKGLEGGELCSQERSQYLKWKVAHASRLRCSDVGLERVQLVLTRLLAQKLLHPINITRQYHIVCDGQLA